MAIVESIDSKIERAAVLLLHADADLSTYYTRGSVKDIYRILPGAIQDFVHIPMLTVEGVPERFTLNREVAKFASPVIHVRFRFWEYGAASPVEIATPAPVTIIDRIVHLEKLLEAGTDANNQGILFDPASVLGDPPTVRNLTTNKPLMTRETPQQIDTTPTSEQATIALVYSVVATYQTTQHAITRTRINP